jgi:hypothetical protein
VKSTRAFSLLEVAVASALMSVVFSMTVSVMATVLAGNRRARAHSEILRDGTFVSELFNTEIRQAGLGVPPAFDNYCAARGYHIRRSCTAGVTCTSLFGTTPPLNFNTSVIVAAASQVGIVADLPRADGQYSAYGPLHDRPTGQSDATSAEWLVWHTENNGGCAPGNTCTLADFSTFFFDTTAAQICAATNPNARTCPWGMNRVRGGERIQIVAGDGNWSHAALAAGPVVGDVGGGRLGVSLSPGFDINNPASAAFILSGVWGNRAQSDGPGAISGVADGWVMTLDRVFFFHDAPTKTIQRVQCSGDPDPNHASWPNATATVMPALASLALTPATSGGVPAAANTCVGPEVVARHVESLTFQYFNAQNTLLTAPISGVVAPTCPGPTPPASGKSSIRRIDYVINFSLSPDANPVTHNVRGSVRLQNL